MHLFPLLFLTAVVIFWYQVQATTLTSWAYFTTASSQNVRPALCDNHLLRLLLCSPSSRPFQHHHLHMCQKRRSLHSCAVPSTSSAASSSTARQRASQGPKWCTANPTFESLTPAAATAALIQIRLPQSRFDSFSSSPSSRGIRRGELQFALSNSV